VNRMVTEYTEDEYLSAPSEGDIGAGDNQRAE
jgi:hypothetical protein